MRRRTVILVLTILVAAVGLTIVTAVSAHLAGTRFQEPTQSSAAQNRREPGSVRMLRFMVFENSIYPRKLTTSAGIVRLVQEDKTGRSKGLIVERANEQGGGRVVVIKPKEDQRRGAELLRLTPGVYRVFDSTSPANSAELIVEP